jgi:hypothetical protein
VRRVRCALGPCKHFVKADSTERSDSPERKGSHRAGLSLVSDFFLAVHTPVMRLVEGMCFPLTARCTGKSRVGYF